MKNVQQILEDPEITSIRLVVNPEKMVINETKAGLHLFLFIWHDRRITGH